MLRRLCLTAMVASALVACSDDDDTSEPDAQSGSAYYHQLAVLIGELDEENTAADQELNDAVPTADPAEIGDLFSQATHESADRLEAALDEMDALDPPDDAAAAHEEFLAATRAELQLSREFAFTLAGLDQAGIEALRPPPQQADIERLTDLSCLDIQDLADASGADVELCVGMFALPAGG